MDLADSKNSKGNLGQGTIGIDQLRQAAERAFSGFDGTQQDLAQLIDVDDAAVSRALRESGLQHASVQAKIISGAENVPVQRRSTYSGAEVKRTWIIDPGSGSSDDGPAETDDGSTEADDTPGDDGDGAPETSDLPLFSQQ